MFCASRRKSIGFGLSLSRIMKCHAGIHAVIATILISPNMSYPWACFYEARIEKHFVFPAMFFTTELLLMMVCEFIACACRNSCYRAFKKRELCSDWHSCFRPPKVGDNRSPKVGDDLWQCFFFAHPSPSIIKPWQGKECAQELWRISLIILRHLFGIGIDIKSWILCEVWCIYSLVAKI